MKQKLLALIKVYFFWLLVFVLEKPIFLALNRGMTEEPLLLSDWFEVMYRGLPLDTSLAAYVTVIPGLLMAASYLFSGKVLNPVWRFFLLLFSFYTTLSFVLNLILYPYWGFPLDNTPISMFVSAPVEGVSSAPAWVTAVGVTAVIVITRWLYLLQRNVLEAAFLTNPGSPKMRWLKAFSFLCITGLLIIPIRGGLNTSTTNTGKVFYSTNRLLNHCAVNPAFNFLESLTIKENYGEAYRFMNSYTVTSLSDSLLNTSSSDTEEILKNRRPDVYVVILESFSMNLWNTIAVPNLKETADSGILFTNFYANSFRTDRGLTSIMSGYPAPPTSSLMRNQKIAGNLPSFSRSLSDSGYALKYYYGGDADFVSMRSYLVNQNFTSIISDKDFTMSERCCSWGVPDGILMSKVISGIESDTYDTPVCRIIQTSSSHEPYDVPYHHLNNERLNAFAYTDSCVGSFVRALRSSDRWDKSLIILVADHYGCYPENLAQDNLNRYHIPCIWTGGAIDSTALAKYRDGMPVHGSQQDLAATLLGQMGIPHDDFIFSKDLFDPDIKHFAFFTAPDIFGMVSDSSYVVFDNKASKPVKQEGAGSDSLVIYGQAYLQRLYDEIEKL